MFKDMDQEDNNVMYQDLLGCGFSQNQVMCLMRWLDQIEDRNKRSEKDKLDILEYSMGLEQKLNTFNHFLKESIVQNFRISKVICVSCIFMAISVCSSAYLFYTLYGK